jgi:uncharacterized protein YndB with AHSA1/START domain
MAGVTRSADSTAARELRAAVTVRATPERVWQVLTDFARMPEWSPELLRMVPLKRGGLRLGQWYLGINRRGAVVWPTRSVVTVLEPARTVAWDTRSSGARWIYDLQPATDAGGGDEGTRLTLTRPVPQRLTYGSKVFATALLGGADSHADELEVGMQQTLERLKHAVEGD